VAVIEVAILVLEVSAVALMLALAAGWWRLRRILRQIEHERARADRVRAERQQRL
jgi:heme exporter protein D